MGQTNLDATIRYPLHLC